MLNKNAMNKEETKGIVELSKKAEYELKRGKKVVNATVGMLYHKNKLFKFDVVKNILSKMNYNNLFKYSCASYSNEFHENMLTYLFKESKLKYKIEFYQSSLPTIGGTGALHLCFSNYIEDEPLILPKITWSPYKTILKEANKTFVTYDTFINDQYNIDALEIEIDKSINKYKKAVFLINDPCSNPIGYSFSEDESNKLINMLNKKEEKILFILDVAYIDFSKARHLIENLYKLNNNIVIYICISLSKSLSIYGVRSGAALILSKQNSDIFDFNKAITHSIRGMYSNTPKFGIELFNKVYNSKENIESYKTNCNKAKQLIKKRSTLFIKYAKENNLRLLPYKEGFYISIYNDSNLYDKLIENNIYCVKFDEIIRIALCSMSIYDIELFFASELFQ